MSPGYWSAGSDADDDGSGISDDDEGAGEPGGGADAGANGCAWDVRVINYAVFNGHAAVADWARANGCPQQ